VFQGAVRKEWFDAVDDDEDSVRCAQATDMVFNMLRHKAVIRGGWTEFNQTLSQNDQDVTAIGYISAALGQQHTVLTIDQALYSKLVELRWAIPEYQKKLIVQLGSLHISMCFQKAIRNHMKGSGLVEAWVASGLLGPNTTEHVMNGKAYKRAMHAHKITLQSLWQLLMPFPLAFCQNSYPDLFQAISDLACSPDNARALITSLKSPRVKKMLDKFVTQRSKEMSISNFGGTTWKWYLFSSCSHGLRERGYGTCTCTVSATCCHILSDMTI